MDRSLSLLLYFVVNFAHLLGQVPYKWDAKTHQLMPTTSLQWKIGQILTPPHLIYVIFRFLSSIPNESLIIIISQAIFSSGITMHYVFHITYTLNSFKHVSITQTNTFLS